MSKRITKIALTALAVGGLHAAAAAAPLAAQDAASKLSIHGYLTQGYGIADSSQIIGINDQGTSDYRRAAVLLRYAASPQDNIVLQFAHRRLGESPITALEADVQLDWAYYERRFGSATKLRVGKAPIPMGIYNETRYVGTLMPFYRAPLAFYGEGVYTSETVNGAVLSHHFMADRPLSLDVSAYGGEWNFLEADGGNQGVVETRARKAFGGQAWVNTPLPGVRLGAGGFRYTASEGALRAPGVDTDVAGWHLSLDATNYRYFLRSEYRNFWYEGDDTRALDVKAFYAQAGVKVTEEFGINAQAEVADLGLDAPLSPVPLDVDYSRDYALGVTYAISPSLVLKGEAHQAKGFSQEQTISFAGEPLRTRYTVLSISASF